MRENSTHIIDTVGRRWFLKQTSLAAFVAATPLGSILAAGNQGTNIPAPAGMQKITLSINRKSHTLDVEPRETLLDVLRERLDLTGAKKGCDHGQCGACTVHIDGRPINSCLTLAAMQQDREITTIEGLTRDKDVLHPLQKAFITHDGFQCGFCTCGQIMSGVAVIREGHANSQEEIREWMSGNICRCGAYNGIVDAIESVKNEGGHI